MTQTCTMSVQKLQTAPWLLPIGNSVFAKIVAVNSMGSSLTSSAGNGAVLGLSVVPDAPINLARDN